MMSTAIATARAPAPPAARELRVYSHTGLLFWWPVWAVGLLMAAWTLIEDHHMALVPAGTVAAGNTLAVPDGGAAVLTPVHMSASRTPGMVFALTVLAVAAFGSGWVRSWRAYTFAACAAAAVLLVNWLGGWDDLARWAAYLHVHINLGGYLLLAGGLFLLWAAQVLVADRRRYIVFTESQVLVHHEIGEQEQAYDTAGIAFEKAPYDWFRWAVGGGAGDLRVRVGGQWVEIPNVIRVGRRLGAIERMLRTKDVD
jgi:hypothetical protein